LSNREFGCPDKKKKKGKILMLGDMTSETTRETLAPEYDQKFKSVWCTVLLAGSDRLHNFKNGWPTIDNECAPV
jgi:hypothetical protein